MGWASGSELLSEVWEITRPYIPKEKRVGIMLKLMDKFEDHDCDTLDEVERDDWPEVEEALRKKYPDEDGD